MANVEQQGDDRARRKVVEGVVISDRMEKTVVVQTERKLRHPLYKRVVRQRVKLYAHDEQGVAKEGSRVRLVETRPLSKNKRWRVVEVLS
ncbi:MAG: 30S ribosomal protein S17 [Nitrospirota bacterium]|nr:30S ribosomal protein S17 [Nitrospirota bacterium]